MSTTDIGSYVVTGEAHGASVTGALLPVDGGRSALGVDPEARNVIRTEG